MLILIFIIAIIAIVMTFKLNNEFVVEALGIVGFLAIIICITLSIFLGVNIVDGRYIDDKIAMYENENNKIEQQIAESINAYLEHESKVFESTNEKINPESAITIVAAYPELNSSELITKQIEVYHKNNEEIKDLKAKKIDIEIDKWWLYFG